MKNYVVRNEYWDAWGIATESESMVSHSEIERLAAEWELTVEELIEQVEEI